MELFWQRAKTNLQAGKIRLVFVADEIPPELRRVVEFLNNQMDPAEVLAVKIRQYTAEGGFQTLVPTVMGQTAEAQQRKNIGPRESRQWDEATFFDSLQAQGTAPVRAAHAILDWARAHATRIWWGKGKEIGSFVPVLRHNEVDHQLLAIYSNGYVEVSFQHYVTKAPFSDIAMRRELLSRLNAIKGVAISDSAVDKRPSIKLSTLVDEDNLRTFLDVFSWVVATIAAS